MTLQEAALQVIPVDKLVLDEQNPRFLHLAHKGGPGLNQSQIEQEILDNDDDILMLTKTIQKSGVRDPIWVVRSNDGRFIVMEGNRRTVVLKRLLREKAPPPPGIEFHSVQAHVLPSDTPPVELILQKARLQSGKKAWGAFNEAALTYQLQQAPHLMHIEDIAVDLKIPIAKVRERIENYKLFAEYVKSTGEDNPKRFAYFAECPPKVREWFRETPQNKADYFRLICPSSKEFYKIRSVATRGGLRDFARVIEDSEALKMLLEDPHCSVEEALEFAKDNDITKAAPFVKKLAPLAMSLRGLDGLQLEKLKAEVKFRVDLRSLREACQEVLDRLGK
jgi:hypothetical protein